MIDGTEFTTEQQVNDFTVRARSLSLSVHNRIAGILGDPMAKHMPRWAIEKLFAMASYNVVVSMVDLTICEFGYKRFQQSVGFVSDSDSGKHIPLLDYILSDVSLNALLDSIAAAPLPVKLKVCSIWKEYTTFVHAQLRDKWVAPQGAVCIPDKCAKGTVA